MPNEKTFEEFTLGNLSLVNMISLVWMLVGAQALATPGTSYDLATWEGFLLRVDPSLPTTSALNSKICYYFDVSQTCSGEAIGTLLGKAAITNPLHGRLLMMTARSF